MKVKLLAYEYHKIIKIYPFLSNLNFISSSSGHLLLFNRLNYVFSVSKEDLPENMGNCVT